MQLDKVDLKMSAFSLVSPYWHVHGSIFGSPIKGLEEFDYELVRLGCSVNISGHHSAL